MGLEHVTIEPSEDCRRLNHPTQITEGISMEGVGPTEFCQLCTVVYRDAIRAGLSSEDADLLVNKFRSDNEPFPGGQDG